MSEHTPFPWNLIVGRTLIHIESDASAERAGVSVCSLPKSKMADALIIYAAPKMLKAAEALRDEGIDCLGRPMRCDEKDPCGACQLWAAIDEARGGQ